MNFFKDDQFSSIDHSTLLKEAQFLRKYKCDFNICKMALLYNELSKKYSAFKSCWMTASLQICPKRLNHSSLYNMQMDWR